MPAVGRVGRFLDLQAPLLFGTQAYFPSHDYSWFGFIDSIISIFSLDLNKSKSNAKKAFMK
jgi:hypothetical protein